MVCAHLPITENTCSLTDRWLLTVTPGILIDETREYHLTGLVTTLDDVGYVYKQISTDILRLRLRVHIFESS